MQSTVSQQKNINLEALPPAILNYVNGILKENQRLKNIENNYKTLQCEYEVLDEKYKKLIYQRFARSAEKLLNENNQHLLFDSEETINTEPVKTSQNEFEKIKSYTRKKAGRKPLDPKLPREERIIDIDETEKTCACGSKLTRIGEETSEKLQIIPPSIYVEKTIRPKYACRCCEGTEDEAKKTVRIAPVEPAIIPKSIASPSLLSCIMIQKFEDHLPYYRQEKQFQRIMVTISRQDMSNWQQQAYNRIKPLIDLMKEELKKGLVMKMDETPVQVFSTEGSGEKRHSETTNSHMWLALGGAPY